MEMSSDVVAMETVSSDVAVDMLGGGERRHVIIGAVEMIGCGMSDPVSIWVQPKRLS